MLNRSIAAVVTALLLTAPAVAATADPVVEATTGKYELDLAHASIIWKVSHLGLSQYPGRFVNFEGTLDFDAAKPEKSRFNISIDATSIRTEFPFREKKDFDGELVKNWFKAGTYPKITFVSKSITRTSSTTADVTGDLTLMGVTKPVTLKTKYNSSRKEHIYSGKPVIGFSATGKLKRSDFGMKLFVPMIGDEVTLDIEAEFMQPK
jgi:polyisoprenoid-binding protein YceI